MRNICIRKPIHGIGNAKILRVTKFSTYAYLGGTVLSQAVMDCIESNNKLDEAENVCMPEYVPSFMIDWR